MAVQRSPPSSTSAKSPTMFHCNSDTAIDRMLTEDTLENSHNVTKRFKRTFNEFSHSTPSDCAIKSMISELKEQIELKFEALTNSMNTMSRKNEEMHKSVQFMSAKYDGVLSKIDCLVQENTAFKTRIKTLESKLEYFESTIRSSSIEIRNIPKQVNENKNDLNNIIKDIGTVIGLETPINEMEIRNIYRSKSDAIIADFTSATRKESMVFTAKKFNKAKRDAKEPQLNTAHLKIMGPAKPIYISESLTTQAQRLYYLTRGYVKNKKLAATWTSYGKIYVKKEEGQAPIRIKEEAEILRIIM